MWVFNYREHRSRKASRNLRSVKEHRGVVKKYLYGERHDLQKGLNEVVVDIGPDIPRGWQCQ